MATSGTYTADSVTTNAWFRMEGSASTTNLVTETDDNTTDNNDIATGSSLATTTRRLKVDFSNGQDDVRFYVRDPLEIAFDRDERKMNELAKEKV